MGKKKLWMYKNSPNSSLNQERKLPGHWASKYQMERKVQRYFYHYAKLQFSYLFVLADWTEMMVKSQWGVLGYPLLLASVKMTLKMCLCMNIKSVCVCVCLNLSSSDEAREAGEQFHFHLSLNYQNQRGGLSERLGLPAWQPSGRTFTPALGSELVRESRCAQRARQGLILMAKLSASLVLKGFRCYLWSRF